MIHPLFVPPISSIHQSALFTPRNDRVYSHYEFPLFFDGDGERVTAALHCYTNAVDDQRPALHQPGFGRGLVADFGRRATLALHCCCGFQLRRHAALVPKNL
jgi:hypothetical protein